jgi:hypothetical protein
MEAVFVSLVCVGVTVCCVRLIVIAFGNINNLQ